MTCFKLASLLSLALTLAASANPVPLFDGKSFTYWADDPVKELRILDLHEL